MRFVPVGHGPVLVESDAVADQRGHFVRVYDRALFLGAGLRDVGEQLSWSHNRVAGTVRGMHWQVPPSAEAKLVRCVAGAILDQVVDVRPGSPTYGTAFAVELTAAADRALYVPPLFAHGFQTLRDDTAVLYQMDVPHDPGAERGACHDDPALGLEWPLPVTAISRRDRSWPPFPRPARP